MTAKDRHEHLRRTDRPIYPKAFFEKARLHRERGRVFVVMPFEDDHANDLWDIIQHDCKLFKLPVYRADSAPHPNAVLTDILDEIGRAEIIIADLTKCNPNVLYELGIAHMRCDFVILICKEGQKLPFDLQHIRCISYDLSTVQGGLEFSQRLRKKLLALKEEGQPEVIKSSSERTEWIIKDLEELASRPDEKLSDQTVWFSGFLSAFAIGPKEKFKDNDYRTLLLKEKDALLELARRGCRVRCIINPAGQRAMVPAKVDVAIQRTTTLLDFLRSEDPALKNIEWVVSPYRQKNLYIIGQLSYHEGFKKGIQRGFSLTLRHKRHDAIDAHISLYEALFDALSIYTLENYSQPGGTDRREALRRATINCLEKSLAFLKSQQPVE